jgi:hypothetical protein
MKGKIRNFFRKFRKRLEIQKNSEILFLQFKFAYPRVDNLPPHTQSTVSSRRGIDFRSEQLPSAPHLDLPAYICRQPVFSDGADRRPRNFKVRQSKNEIHSVCIGGAIPLKSNYTENLFAIESL